MRDYLFWALIASLMAWWLFVPFKPWWERMALWRWLVAAVLVVIVLALVLWPNGN